MAIIWVGSPSHASDVFVDQPLQACQNILREREAQIEINPLGDDSINTLEKCNGELAVLYDPSLLANKELKFEDFTCKIWHLGCVLKDALAVDYLAISGPKTHANQIRKRMGKKALDRLTEYVDHHNSAFPNRSKKQDGLEVIVKKAYDEFAETDSWFAEGSSGFFGSIAGFFKEQTVGYRYEELKPIVGEVTYHFIRSEMSGFGFDLNQIEDKKKIDELATKYKSSLKLCFDQARHLESLNYCVDLLMTNASYGIGQIVVDRILETKFLEEVSSGRQQAFIGKVDEYFNKCLPGYFYNSELEKNAFDRIKGCVYGTIIHAFELAVDEAIQSEMGSFLELDKEKIKTLRDRSIALCEADEIYKPEKIDFDYFDSLEKMEANEFEEELLSCQEKVKGFLVSEIINQTIMNEPKLVEFYGEGIQKFMEQVNNTHYPQCLSELGESGRSPKPQLCKSYLFVATVFDFFNDAIKMELKKQIEELFGNQPPSDLSEEKLLADANSKVTQCRGELLKDSLNKPDWERESLEKSLIGCLSKGISVITSKLSEKLVPIELATNDFVQKYNVTIGSEMTQEFALQFSQCMDNGLSEVDGLLQLTDILSVLKEECKFQSYKTALPYILDQVLENELIGAGLMGDEFERVMEAYKSHPESLYSLVPLTQDQDELNLLTEGADQKVLAHLAPPVVQILVESKAGDYLGPKTEASVVREVSDELLKCTKDKPIADCTDSVETFAIRKVLKIVLPGEVEKEIKNAAADYIPDFSGLYIKEVIAANLDYPTGKMMIEFLVEEMKMGKSIEEITAVHAVPNTFRTLMVTIFNNNPKFKARILNAIIQPQLDAEKEKKESNPFGWLAVNLFVHKEIFKWNNIKDMPSGIEVQAIFDTLLERVMTEEDATIEPAEMARLEDLVAKAAKEKNRQLNQLKRANRRNNNN